MDTETLIARRPAGRAGLAEWYTELFEAQRAEGMSVLDLAVLLDVTPTNVYYWRRRLRELAVRGNRGKAGRPKPGLVRVEIQEDLARKPAAASSRLEVRLSHSRSILVTPGFDPAALLELVTALEAC